MGLLVIEFLIGITILLFSTEQFINAAKKISLALRISPLIIGITIVAIGTSLPELSVSVISMVKNDVGLALGNIIGSNIVNILMVFPVGLFIGKLRIGTIKTQFNAVVLVLMTLVFYLTQTQATVRPVSGPLLIGLAVIICITEYYWGVKGRSHEDVLQFKHVEGGKIGIGMMLWVLLFLLGIVIGSILIVNSVEGISVSTGISTTILGLTLTAVATSLPELLTTIFSQATNSGKITIGNILGSNIYNLLLVGGIISLFPYTYVIKQVEWLWLFGTTIIFVTLLHVYRARKPPQLVGVGLFLLLIFYLVLR